MTEPKTKFEVPENVLVCMFIEKMKEYGTTTSGTYNQMDPTHWEETKVQLFLDDGQDMNPIDIVIKDVTWITTITFSESGDELAKADWEPQDKKWININAPAFFDLIYDVFIRGIHESKMESDHDDPFGCLADYE